MKKVVSIILALVLMLGCASALAEKNYGYQPGKDKLPEDKIAPQQMGWPALAESVIGAENTKKLIKAYNYKGGVDINELSKNLRDLTKEEAFRRMDGWDWEEILGDYYPEDGNLDLVKQLIWENAEEMYNQYSALVPGTDPEALWYFLLNGIFGTEGPGPIFPRAD